jgi:hypothetical protein
VRLWTLHPGYLDARGLVAAWRESLLAQRVLEGRTRGYRHHPQLVRFRAAGEPLAAIAAYLGALADEADARGYRFDRTRIAASVGRVLAIEETEGQLRFEAGHLAAKLARRSPGDLPRLAADPVPRAHPLFRIVPGPVREWEKATPGAERVPARGASRIVRS